MSDKYTTRYSGDTEKYRVKKKCLECAYLVDGSGGAYCTSSKGDATETPVRCADLSAMYKMFPDNCGYKYSLFWYIWRRGLRMHNWGSGETGG